MLKNNSIHSKISNILYKKSIIPALLIVYALMIIIFTSINKDYLSVGNIKNIIINLTIPGILAVGLSTVILTGNVDLSISSTLGVSAIVVAKLYNIQGLNIPIPLIILAALMAGLIIGAINGFLVTIVGVNSIIATLGTLAIFRGVAYMYMSETAIISYKPFLSIGRTYIFKHIPITLIYFIVILVGMYLILRFTKFGKDVYSTGANYFISKIYGVNVKRIQFTSFVISSLTASAGGIIMASYLSYADGSFGERLEFKVLTICVLGGIALIGGRGTLLGTFVATLVIGSISSGLVMIGVTNNYRELFIGIILIIAIFINSIRYSDRNV